MAYFNTVPKLTTSTFVCLFQDKNSLLEYKYIFKLIKKNIPPFDPKLTDGPLQKNVFLKKLNMVKISALQVFLL